MKYQLNWQIFDISSNYLMKKKIDDCVILYDDKDYILFVIKYYKELLFNTYHNEEIDATTLEDIYKTEVENEIKKLIDYSEYQLAPIYFSEIEEGFIIVNIGIFIIKGMKNVVNKSKLGNVCSQCFMAILKEGIEPINADIDELRVKRYPELKTDIDDILYIKQSGFYLNLFKSIYLTSVKSTNKSYITIPIMSLDDTKTIDISNAFIAAYPHWERWQIIWRSNRYAITQYFKSKRWNSMSCITDNITKKYRNIVFNQSIMSENHVLNSINFNTFKPIKPINTIKYINDDANCNDSHNDSCNNKVDDNNKLKGTNSFKNMDSIDITINKFSNMNICGKKYKGNKGKKEGVKTTSSNDLVNFARFSGSKHLHYLQKDKIKDKELLKLLKELNI
jgi:hypothetical protein